MPEQREIEIALRDSVSTGLKQLGREIDTITRKLVESGQAGDKSFAQFGKGSEEAKKHADKAKESLTGLSGFMTGMSRTLLGATGIAAGFYAVGTSLTDFAQKRVQVQLLAKDIGLTSDQVSVMRRTLENMGVAAGQQDKYITGLGEKLKEVFRLHERAPFLQELAKMRMGEFGQKILREVESGDIKKAFDSVIEAYHKIEHMYGIQAAEHFASIVGWPPSLLKGYEEANKGVQAAYQASFAESEEYLRTSLEFTRKFNDQIMTPLKGAAMSAFIDLDKEIRKYQWQWIGGILPVPKDTRPIDERLPGMKGMKEPKRMGSFDVDQEGGRPKSRIESYVEQGIREEDKKTNRLLNEISDTLKIYESSTSTTRTPGGGYSTRGGLATGIDLNPSDGGGDESSGGGSGRAPSPRFNFPRRSSGGGREPLAPAPHSPAGGGGSGSGGAGRQSLPESHHAPIETQQPITGGGNKLSGVRSKFAEELKDPAVRDRLMAYTFAEVGAEGPQAAKAFMEETMNRAAARGKSIKETLSGSYFPKITHTRARALWGLTPERRSEYGSTIDEVMSGSNVANFATGNASGSVGFGKGGYQTSKFGRERFGVEAADVGWAKSMRESAGGGTGIVGGGNRSIAEMTEKMAPAGSRVGSSAPGGLTTIITESGKKFQVAKDYASNFLGFLNDYEKSGGNIGPHSGGVGSRPGNASYHPRGMAFDLNQVGYGIRSKLGKTLPKDVEEELASKWGLYPGSKFQRRSDIGHFEVRNRGAAAAALERNSIDGAMKSKTTNKAHQGFVKAEVDFSNMPKGFQKTGDDLGKFKLIKLNAAPQGAKDHEGMLAPGDLSHTPAVP